MYYVQQKMKGARGEHKAKRQRCAEGDAEIPANSNAFEEEARAVKSPPIPETPSLEEVRTAMAMTRETGKKKE